MAQFNRIWLHNTDLKEGAQMTVHVTLRPAGEAQVRVPIPQDFYDCLLKMAQAAADLHEQQMRAQILADNQQSGGKD